MGGEELGERKEKKAWEDMELFCSWDEFQWREGASSSQKL